MSWLRLPTARVSATSESMRLHEAIRVAPARLALALWYYGKDEADIIVEQLRATYDDATRLTGRDYLAEINAIVEQRAT
jgi:hypothetical protein